MHLGLARSDNSFKPLTGATTSAGWRIRQCSFTSCLTQLVVEAERETERDREREKERERERERETERERKMNN